jgi:hypothetical protein
METDRPQQDRPAACVIAQQYSSAAFFSQQFHSRQQMVGVGFKNVISVFNFLKNCVS